MIIKTFCTKNYLKIPVTKDNKSNTECGIISPTKAFTWDHIYCLA